MGDSLQARARMRALARSPQRMDSLGRIDRDLVERLVLGGDLWPDPAVPGLVHPLTLYTRCTLAVARQIRESPGDEIAVEDCRGHNDTPLRAPEQSLYSAALAGLLRIHSGRVSLGDPDATPGMIHAWLRYLALHPGATGSETPRVPRAARQRAHDSGWTRRERRGRTWHYWLACDPRPAFRLRALDLSHARRLWEWLRQHRTPSTVAQITQSSGMTDTAVRRAFDALLTAGLAHRDGGRPAAYWGGWGHPRAHPYPTHQDVLDGLPALAGRGDPVLSTAEPDPSSPAGTHVRALCLGRYLVPTSPVDEAALELTRHLDDTPRDLSWLGRRVASETHADLAVTALWAMGHAEQDREGRWTATASDAPLTPRLAVLRALCDAGRPVPLSALAEAAGPGVTGEALRDVLARLDDGEVAWEHPDYPGHWCLTCVPLEVTP